MSTTGHNANAQLKSIIERIERLEEEKKAIADDIREIYAEAKGNGYDAKALRAIVRLRKQDAAERAEQEAILDVYKAALGMLADLPLGQAAVEKATTKPVAVVKARPEPVTPPAAPMPAVSTADAPFHAPADDEVRSIPDPGDGLDIPAALRRTHATV